MNYILDLIACSLMTLAEVIGVILLAILIQLIFYRVFNINLYKKLVKVLERG